MIGWSQFGASPEQESGVKPVQSVHLAVAASSSISFPEAILPFSSSRTILPSVMTAPSRVAGTSLKMEFTSKQFGLLFQKRPLLFCLY